MFFNVVLVKMFEEKTIQFMRRCVVVQRGATGCATQTLERESAYRVSPTRHGGLLLEVVTQFFVVLSFVRAQQIKLYIGVVDH